MITGATGALGKATALRLARQDGTVVLLSRERASGEAVADEVRRQRGSDRVELLVADLSVMDSVRSVAQDFLSRHDALDVLLNAAAVFTRERRVTSEGLEVMFATNVLGPFLLTNLLLAALRKGRTARILTVSAPSTSPIDFDDVMGEREFRPLHAFGATKTADMLFAYELARRLESTGVTSNVIHPGLMKSGLMREASAPLRVVFGMMSRRPDRAADAVVQLVSSSAYEGATGRFYKGTRVSESSPYSRDPRNQRRLWDVAAKLTNLPGASGSG
jgi:NAD(P)-dependent dehydrogenase (short-subunit alcohol dehydrogenase family)